MIAWLQRGVGAAVRSALRLDATQWRVLGLVARALVVASVVCAFDALPWTAPESVRSLGAHFVVGLADRRDYVGGLLTLSGLPTALLVTLTSLAIGTLSPYANPAPLLLHRRWPTTALEWFHALVFLGRGNPFLFALQGSLYVSASLAGLLVLEAAGWAALRRPTLLAVTLLAIWNLALLLYFVFWTVRLRQPEQLIEHLRLLARNRLESLSTRAGGFTDRAHESAPRVSAVSSPREYSYQYVEQAETAEVILALGQALLRAATDAQPSLAIQAAAALKDALSLTREAHAVPEWGATSEGPRGSWASELVVEALGEGLATAGEKHVHRPGEEIAKTLAEALRATTRVGRPQDPNDRRVVAAILSAQTLAFQRCSVARETALRDYILDRFQPALADLRRHWKHRLSTLLLSEIGTMAREALRREDVGGLRGALGLLHATVGPRTAAIELVLDLGATGIALRADRTTSALAGWCVSVLDPSGSRIPLAAEEMLARERRRALTAIRTAKPPTRPTYVGTDYVRVFLALLGGRAGHYVPPWPEASLEKVSRVVWADSGGLPNPRERAAWVCERISNVVGLAAVETERWVGSVLRVVDLAAPRKDGASEVG